MRRPTRTEMAVAAQARRAEALKAATASRAGHAHMMKASTDAAFGHMPMPGGRALSLPNGGVPDEYNATGLGGYFVPELGKWWD